jgi:hypothetical protein
MVTALGSPPPTGEVIVERTHGAAAAVREGGPIVSANVGAGKADGDREAGETPGATEQDCTLLKHAHAKAKDEAWAFAGPA